MHENGKGTRMTSADRLFWCECGVVTYAVFACTEWSSLKRAFP